MDGPRRAPFGTGSYPSGLVHIYMFIGLVSLDCTIYLLGVGEFAFEVSRLIQNNRHMHLCPLLKT